MKATAVAVLTREIDRDLRAIRQALRRPADRLIAQGQLTGPQVSVLEAVLRSPGLSLKELKTQVGLAHSTVSTIVDRLERRGLLQRGSQSTDGRVTTITASRPVRRYVKQALPRVMSHPLRRALARARPAERAVIATGLGTLRRLLE